MILKSKNFLKKRLDKALMDENHLLLNSEKEIIKLGHNIIEKI